MATPMGEVRKSGIVSGIRWAFGGLDNGPPCDLDSTTS
jgi:hypothetical protein